MKVRDLLLLLLVIPLRLPSELIRGMPALRGRVLEVLLVRRVLHFLHRGVIKFLSVLVHQVLLDLIVGFGAALVLVELLLPLLELCRVLLDLERLFLFRVRVLVLALTVSDLILVQLVLDLGFDVLKVRGQDFPFAPAQALPRLLAGLKLRLLEVVILVGVLVEVLVDALGVLLVQIERVAYRGGRLVAQRPGGQGVVRLGIVLRVEELLALLALKNYI